MFNSFFFRISWIFLKCIVDYSIISLLCTFFVQENSFSCQIQEFLRVLSLSIIVSLSRTISFLSIETTSPVSSSTKSSCHVFNTRAASLRPKIFFKPDFDTLTSSARSNISRMSLSLSNPIALNKSGHR